jgi:hypothetical protein
MTDDYRNSKENVKVVGDIVDSLVVLRNLTKNPEVKDEIDKALDYIFELTK